MALLRETTAYVSALTMSDDTPHRVEENPDVWLASGNIHVYSNPAYYGNMRNVSSAVIQPNGVVWFDTPFRPFDWVFKNYTAGSNAQIVITGVLLKKG